MSARPVHEPDPDDPVEILRVLPAQFRDQFLAEYYEAASEAARQVGGYRQLHDLLRLWRLSAAAYSDPGSEERPRPFGRLSGPAAWKGLHRSGRSSLAGSTARELQLRFEDGALVQLNGLPGAAFGALHSAGRRRPGARRPRCGPGRWRGIRSPGGPADVEGRGVVQQLFLDGVPVEPGDNAEPPGDGGPGPASASRSRPKHSMSARRTWDRRRS
jgi:hypothetical protein